MRPNLLIYITLIVFLFLNLLSHSQPRLWKEKLDNIQTSNSDKTLYSDSLLLYYRKNNPDSALYYAQLILTYSLTDKDTTNADYALMHLGSLHRIKGNYDSSLFYYQKALASYEYRNFEDGIASVYNNIATVHKTQGRYDLAMYNYHEANLRFQFSENLFVRANLLSNFAGLYYKLENYDKAYEYWSLAKKLYLLSVNSYEVTHAYRGLCRITIHQQKYDEAEQLLLETIDLDVKNNIKVFLADDYVLGMELYIKLNNQNQFLAFQKNAKNILFELNLPLTKSLYYEHSGDFYKTKNELIKSLEYFDSSLFFIATEDISEIKLRLLKKRFTVKVALKDMKELSDDLAKIYALEEEVALIRKDRLTQEMDATYNLNQKEELIKNLDEKNESQQKLLTKEIELKNQRQQQVIVLSVGIALLILVSFWILMINRKLTKTKKELELAIDQKDFLFKELNHRVKNNLHIMNSLLSIEMNGKSDEVVAILKTIENRIYSLGLMHEMLYQSDNIEFVVLEDYFKKLTDYLSKTLANERVQFTVDVSPEIVFSSNKIVLLGLVANELITNSLKHAKKNNEDLKIKLQGYIENNTIILLISDNGSGLPENFNTVSVNSLGMKLATGLIKQLKGKLIINSSEKGSVFEIHFA